MTDLALGSAVYFDTDLSTDPSPLFTLWNVLACATPSDRVTQWMTSEATQQVGKPARADLDALRRVIASGTVASAAIETSPGTRDPDRVLVLAQTMPVAKLREGVPPRQWRSNLVVAIGSAALSRIGWSTAVAAIVAFADTVAVKAGIVHWLPSMSYAAGLAMGAGGGLTTAEESRISDSLYWRSHWGRVVRSPAWGTFLSAAHVEQIGGLGNLRGCCAHLVELRSGGAFLQLTEEPILDGSPNERLAALRTALGSLAVDTY